MEIERSGVPGYEATLITLEPAEQFPLRAHGEPELVLQVQTVTVFDPPADGLVADPYFVASGVTLIDEQPQEIVGTDFGVLPPHVKEAVVATTGFEPKDHAPEEKLGPERAQHERLSRQGRKGGRAYRPSEVSGGKPWGRAGRGVPQVLGEAEVARLRDLVGLPNPVRDLTPPAPTAGRGAYPSTGATRVPPPVRTR